MKKTLYILALLPWVAAAGTECTAGTDTEALQQRATRLTPVIRAATQVGQAQALLREQQQLLSQAAALVNARTEQLLQCYGKESS